MPPPEHEGETVGQATPAYRLSRRTRRYWQVRRRREAIYRFEPYASTSLVRFFMQRSSGYMSVYRLRDAMRDSRTSLVRRGWRDPMYVSFYGEKPIRLPALRGPARPRKEPLRHGTPAEQCRQFPKHLDSLLSRVRAYNRRARAASDRA